MLCTKLFLSFEINAPRKLHEESRLKRIFVAIEVKSNQTIQKMMEIERSLESLDVPIKTVEPENLHITLAFIGEVEDDVVEAVKEALKSVEGSIINAEFRGIGAFPNANNPRVVWAGVREGSDEIVQLQRKVDSALRSYGIQYEKERNFVPHITLGRVKGKRNLDRLRVFIEKNADVFLGTERFDELKLKESTLTPKGPIYKDLFIQKLRG